jgi:hypothetical protein
MDMKDEATITEFLNGYDTDGHNKFPGMTYEEGVAFALSWVLGEVSDSEFKDSV